MNRDQIKRLSAIFDRTNSATNEYNQRTIPGDAFSNYFEMAQYAQARLVNVDPATEIVRELYLNGGVMIGERGRKLPEKWAHFERPASENCPFPYRISIGQHYLDEKPALVLVWVSLPNRPLEVCPMRVVESWLLSFLRIPSEV